MEIGLSNISEQIDLSDYFFQSNKIEVTAVVLLHFEIVGYSVVLINKYQIGISWYTPISSFICSRRFYSYT